tara:strand:- start:279 stop:794 length:516 start_codon:yes stop_codon:yes gene_type:complete
MKKRNLIFTYIFFIFIFLILYFSLSNEKIYTNKDLVGQKINNVELILFNDSKINLNELRNNEFILINFWASWCSPCRKEHKNLMKLSKYGNLKIVGINFKDEEKKAKNFLDEMGNPFFILAKDPDGKKSVNFGIYGIPETILINKDLKILKKYIGPLNFKDVSEIKKITQK